MKKGSFILYDTDLESLEFLTDEQAGQLFRALAQYRTEGAEPDFGDDAALKILFRQFRVHIEINEEKYKALCEKRSQAANKRWNGDNANACKDMQTNAKLCLNDNVNVNDNDNVNVNDNDACGAKRENKRKNYYSKKTPFAYEGEPSYDIDAFLRKAVGLKYEKKGTPVQGAPL